ncbi:GmrSD restriction endonuclease domain-containing protein [Demequina sp.]|uniref:GmrSD restriction endonuclease domain-containing protein n=1 Tax=Demequina sp. TaxID=2050685 RepID=UPI003D0E4D9E
MTSWLRTRALRRRGAAGEVLEQLSQLPTHAHPYYVQPYPYQRVFFGDEWADVDENGRGTRDDVLAEHLADVQLLEDLNVYSGTLTDAYTGATLEYQRGRDEEDPVVVDHVISLWEAWATGAWSWTPAERRLFANDPANLVATVYSVNKDKGAKNAARWHPSPTHLERAFVQRVIAVKSKYQLEIHETDRSYLASVLHT